MNEDTALRSFAASAIAGTVYSLVHAAGGIPAEMDAARASSEHMHSSYYSVPCRFRGTFTSEGQVYEFSINGGLHGTLRDVRGNEVYLLGCKDRCAKYSPFDMYGTG